MSRPSITPLTAKLLALACVAACAAQAAAAEAPPVTRLQIDPQGSEIGFILSTTWHEVEGKTKSLTGAVTSQSGDLFADGRVSVEVNAASLETGNGRRDRTMREDCLETAKHPAITFVSTGSPALQSTVKDADGNYSEVSFKVPGDLTIHGVTRSVSLPVTARRDGAGWIMTGELPVRLSEHAIPDPSIIFNRVQDEVKVRFSVRVRPAAPAAD